MQTFTFRIGLGCLACGALLVSSASVPAEEVSYSAEWNMQSNQSLGGEPVGPIVELDPYTVTSAAGFEQDIKNAPASISVIFGQDFDFRQFSSLQDIVRDIPGVSVIGAGTQSGISIRGMEKGYTLILIDGKRVRSETGNPRELNNEDLDSSFIPPVSAIERIEVVRGPMSSLYGSDAMGGVINIITKRTPSGWSGRATYGLRVPDDSLMGNQTQRDLYVSGPLLKNRVGISLWANETLQDEDEYYGGYQESTKQTLGGKITITPALNHDLSLDFTNSKQHYIGNPGGVLLPSARSTIDREWTRESWGAAYSAKLDYGKLELKFYEEEYERLTYPSNASYTTGSTNKVGDAKWISEIGNHTLSVGGQWTNDRLTNNELGGGISGGFGTRKVTETAVFAEDEWEFMGDTVFLTLGARLTDNEFFGKQITPRTYLVFNYDEHWTLKGGISTGFKSPKIAQIDRTTGSQRGGGNAQFVIVGNPDLEPEESLNYEIGVIYASQGSFSLGATLFYNDFSNKILNTSPYFFEDGKGGFIAAFNESGAVGTRLNPGWATWLNANGARICGIELDGRWEIFEKLTLIANYTFTDSKIDAGDVTIQTPAGPRSFGETLALLDGNSLVGIPKHNGSATLNYRPFEIFPGFVRLNYEGQITRVSFENNMVDESDKDLVTIDAGVSCEISRSLRFNVTIDNLTNAKRFKVNNDTGAYRYSERGRSYFASIQVQF